MRVYHFTEQPYFPAWREHSGSLRVNLPNSKCDPKIAAELFHRYGPYAMSSASTSCSTSIIRPPPACPRR